MESSLEAIAAELRRVIKEQDHQYIEAHPELEQLFANYLTAFAETRPQDLDTFTEAYFSTLSPSADLEEQLPLMIIGPSGCGKGTFHQKLTRQYPNIFEFSISYTTREPREGEIHGTSYFFISKDDFQRRLDEGDFVEHASYAGNSYGTSKSYLQEIRKRKKVGACEQICLLEIDIKGAKMFFERNNLANALFFAPPDTEELRRRLLKRGTEKPETIEKRIAIAKTELEAAKDSAFISRQFINDDFDAFYAEVLAYLKTLYKNIPY